jgi:Tfp pilus assembly protein PilO
MSYAVRNTLILLSTLVILIAGGWLYLRQFPDKKLEAYETVVAQREKDLVSFKAKSESFNLVREQYIRSLYRKENYNKELFASNNVADIYDFIRRLNDGPAFTQLNFSTVDSLVRDQYGYVTVQLDGTSSYRNFYSFLSRIEQSRPIMNVIRLQVQPKTAPEELQDVVFILTARVFYARGNTTSTSLRTILTNIPSLRHNPLAPLIHAIPSNTDNLSNLESSRLVAVTAGSAFIVDQSGRMVRIDVGGRVYLGFLERISQSSGSATFRLNKGGIEETMTLRIGQPNNSK